MYNKRHPCHMISCTCQKQCGQITRCTYIANYQFGIHQMHTLVGMINNVTPSVMGPGVLRIRQFTIASMLLLNQKFKTVRLVLCSSC